MSEMLDDPNEWHGMSLGETARLGWSPATRGRSGSSGTSLA